MANANIKQIFQEFPSNSVASDDLLVFYNQETRTTRAIKASDILTTSDTGGGFLYSPTKTYSTGDPVIYNGQWWISKTDENIGNLPVEGDNWTRENKVNSITIKPWSSGIIESHYSCFTFEKVVYRLKDTAELPFNSQIDPKQDELNFEPLQIGLLSEKTSTVDVGAITAGQVFPIGTSYDDFVSALIDKTFVPTFEPPQFSLEAQGDSLRTIGVSDTFNLVFNFDRGKILGDIVNGLWDAGAVQNPRAGTAINYTIDGVVQAGNTLSVTKTVAQGINTFSGSVEYGAGAQPLDSKGNDYGTPFPAGTSPSRSDSFEGVYPLFASTSNITTPTQQPLKSMLSANNIVLDLVAETGGNKQFFEIPDAWLSLRPLLEVEFFNTVSGQFEDANKLNTFTSSAQTKSIAGSTVNYTRYTNNQSDRGALKIRLKF